MIDERWRRFPLTSTRVWSGARLRSIAGRTTVEVSLIGCVLTAKDGTIVQSWSCRLTDPWLVGRGEHVDRPRRRGHRARLRAGADDDHLLGEPVQQVLDLVGRQIQCSASSAVMPSALDLFLCFILRRALASTPVGVAAATAKATISKSGRLVIRLLQAAPQGRWPALSYPLDRPRRGADAALLERRFRPPRAAAVFA